MRSIVCIKQTPETSKIKIDPKSGALIREGVPAVMNPDDRNALEAALQIKDQYGGTVSAISMGPSQAKAVLREAYGMGADEAWLVTDEAFAGSDSRATALILAAAVRHLGPFDLIFCGRQSIDGETANVGPEIAEFLNIPQVTYAKRIERNGEGFRITRITDGVDFVIDVSAPLLLTAIQELNTPRQSSLDRFFAAFGQGVVRELHAADIPVDLDLVGFGGSPTQIAGTTPVFREKRGEIIEGESVRDKAGNLLKKLKEVNML
ncbi:MAG: electron transfer flavoprotein subunit beta/FixA family protein [Fusobacteriaceae bacterium]|jgi:electron transfer flavoprotein beta subunit|nr:electron transfer flavoprotein subunit beta/FixA family protein [Fusobacteriaceae bacterium]